MAGVIATALDPSAATFTLPSGQVVYFRLLLAGPEQSREAQVSVRHVPGGNVNVVSFGGLMPAYIRGQALFSSYADFVNMRDNGIAQPPNVQTGTLSYSEGSWPAYLTKISRSRVPASNASSSYMVANVEFLLSI